MKIRMPEYTISGIRTGKQLHGSPGQRLKANSFKLLAFFLFLFSACTDPYFKNDYTDNSPTSGKLKVYYDEGLQLHIKNQAYTFESQYHEAKIELVESSEDDAIQALFNDSCKAIMIGRALSEKERKTFELNKLTPFFSEVAVSGIALITNTATPLDKIRISALKELLCNSPMTKDSSGKEIKMSVLFDKNNSGVIHYLTDSLISNKNFAGHCNVLGSTKESIEYVAKTPNTIAIIDFAWLSDVDDLLYQANKNRVKFMAVENKKGDFEYPSQSSFKLNTYPFIRYVHIYRRASEFSLAKGFESFVAGPKGQMTFLKQGLLPTKQQERSVHVNFEPMNTQ